MFKILKNKNISNFILQKNSRLNISKYFSKYDDNNNNIIDIKNEAEKEDRKSLYKINIPKSEFNERINVKENESKLLIKLTQEFYRDQLKDKNRKLWITHDGPTFTNGKPHLGILYNKIIKDSLNRLKIMQGYKVHYSVGFDCYGIHIEDQVVNLNEKKEIKDVDDLYESQFDTDKPVSPHKTFNFTSEEIINLRKKCRNYVGESIIEQLKYFLRVGIMFDVKSIYSTMSKEYEFQQLEVFKQMYEKGLIYRDNRIVFWSAEEKRILDEDDLEQKSEIRDCIVVKFEIKSFSGETKYLEDEYVKKGKKLFVLGFINEPWKYVGIRALEFNGNNNYSVVQMKDEYFICAYKRIPELARRLGEKKPEILHMARGDAFVNLLIEDPIFKREIPIILNSEVKEVFGTGINIISPAHDFIYEKIYKKYNLSLEGFLDEENYFTPGLGLFLHNTHFMDGNQKIMTKLNNSKHLFATWKFENWFFENKKTFERVAIRSIPSWFFKINKKLKMECFKELSLMDFYPDLNFEKELIKNLKYQPHKLKKEKENIDKNKRAYKNIVEELDDFDEWCISEINSWGIPIPYFVYKTSNTESSNNKNKVLINSEITDHIKNIFYKHGSDIWWTWSVQDLLPEKYKIEAEKLEKGKENFESWFDSSISWFVLLFNNMNKSNLDENVMLKLKEDNSLNKIDEDRIKLTDSDIVEKTKDHLQVLNNKLREFVLQSMDEKIKQQTASETEYNDDEENEPEINLKNANSVRSILPIQDTISHLKQKSLTLVPMNLFPSDILIEGYDQHFNWFLQSLLTSVAMTNHSAFKSLKTNGFILNSAGIKLSKSMKNFIDPLDTIDGSIKTDGERHFGYGSDTLRLFFMKKDIDEDFKLFETFLEKSKSDLKIIRRMSKICLGLLSDTIENKSYINIANSFKFTKANILDQIIMNEFVKFYSKITDNLEKYNFKEYVENILYFIGSSFLEGYLDSAKKNIILLPVNSQQRLYHQYTLNIIFDSLIKLLNPIIPFTCEDIYSHSTHISDKKKYLGLETIPSLEDIMIKLKFTFSTDFDFNVENLIRIKRELNKDINTLLQHNKYSEVKRNQLEIIFLTNESQEGYGELLLNTLGDNLSNFFNVANVYLSEDEYPEVNPELIKTKTLHYMTNVPGSKENIEVKLKYALVKSKRFQCVRCLFYNCIHQNKICDECKNMMID